GAISSYYLFSHVKVRVDGWQAPWSIYNNEGYQIVQGLMAIASGGLLGSGLGLGMPQVIPASHTDYIFAAISEEFGMAVGIMLIIFYLVFIIRGILIALHARNAFDALLVFGCTVMLSLQSFIIIGGVIKLIPLTGITLPFLSYGGSSVASAFLTLGIIEGVAIKNGEHDEAKISEMGGEVL
ncbi:MAG: FtsW/RodA/SpoVE family cell cycle protein, partial [Eubacteriales bacterium]